MKNCESLGLDGLVVIGGDGTNTGAAIIAEFFSAHTSNVKVIGVPKTIDGDLKNKYIEVPFGFDTATKVYSNMIGNILIDGASSPRYYQFLLN